ncbi:MAG: tRNA (adenosine(37)-N6)-threonylcarbamoyltransferase complex dimerization subunit type 1 TsaB [Clostridia bacterium]|nr:tRNA (adenosine(37)-N6)-threonylcarbamoyltransferase complex dimerization subunit type 1 TsaB [Clostridia bacterium]MBQ5798369.1 tRNA (adenosine(37)-N6)-threonylcarbamoyltransferase complex dimerization subunit type 1 TsaB [Clostridia bacterium]MEE1277616.1 tRNA (adenosine(37)-N6)-threonylcarbamoyltransferase complex dimerization subunit type 1 TsaB [Acutalibacteraceae bacterium]
MKILAFECSATAASCAIIENGVILGNAYSNVKLTHSQTLMPMMENLLASTKLSLDDIDSFAVANGPGSFTGIRIGISAVKGLAAAKAKPCIPVSTLLGAAMLMKAHKGIISVVMDARCGQVYNALFKCDGQNLKRLCEDRAILAKELKTEIEKLEQDVIIIGDGADMFYNGFRTDNMLLSPPHLRFQNALGVALAADEANAVSHTELLPFYLRLPQAERELKKRNEDKK